MYMYIAIDVTNAAWSWHDKAERINQTEICVYATRLIYRNSTELFQEDLIYKPDAVIRGLEFITTLQRRTEPKAALKVRARGYVQ